MLKEEAHHMFVGATGVGRVVQRTVELMKEHDTEDVRPYGGLDVATLQRYLNFHYSVSLDLFGAETSTNAANYYAAGLKGRFHEEDRNDDHQLKSDYRTIATLDDGGRVGEREVLSLTALNATLRDDYVEDCAKGVERWNRTLADVGCELRLPHIGFHRAVGEFVGAQVTPDGRVVSAEEWESNRSKWLPTDDDQKYVESLMQPVREPGKMAGWVAPPASGLHGKPVDYEYVKV
jgi:benzoyl-CoA 2,3-dioxygenase component B